MSKKQQVGEQIALLDMAPPRNTIIGDPAEALFPKEGPVLAMCFGEAPGRLGCDRSGVPFAGDTAGLLVYRTLVERGFAHFPVPFESLEWDGAKLRARGHLPTLNRIALSNAYDRCPTDTGTSIRPPKPSELAAPRNLLRLRGEVASARDRGLMTIIAFGKAAERALSELVGVKEIPGITFHTLPHPSRQGLLQMAPNRGKGAKFPDLEKEWMRRFNELLPD